LRKKEGEAVKIRERQVEGGEESWEMDGEKRGGKREEEKDGNREGGWCGEGGGVP
jgi:hypothetical protein